jgi:hypothetical protein
MLHDCPLTCWKAAMRLANSCCFSGGADGAKGSFESMSGMATRTRRVVLLIAHTCPDDPPKKGLAQG